MAKIDRLIDTVLQLASKQEVNGIVLCSVLQNFSMLATNILQTNYNDITAVAKNASGMTVQYAISTKASKEMIAANDTKFVVSLKITFDKLSVIDAYSVLNDLIKIDDAISSKYYVFDIKFATMLAVPYASYKQECLLYDTNNKYVYAYTEWAYDMESDD